jgi:hypothetical protein
MFVRFLFPNNKAHSTDNAGQPRIILHDNSVKTLFLAVASNTGSFDKRSLWKSIRL